MSDISKTVQEINKAHSRIVLHPASVLPPVERVRLYEPMVDYASGGGIPINRVIEFYGPPSSGKSFFAYRTIAKFQHYDWGSRRQSVIKEIRMRPKKIKSGDMDGYSLMEVAEVVTSKSYSGTPKVKSVALIDHEGSYDPVWGAKLGINNDALLLSRPERGTEAINTIETLLYEPNISLIVVDSVGSISSDAEIDNEIEKEQMGVNARMWNKAMRKFTAAMNANPERDVTLLLINRSYDKIGIVYGNPEQVGGGSGINFGKSLSLKFTAMAPVKRAFEGSETVVGRNVKVENKKNKTARPFLEGSLYHSFIDDGYIMEDSTDVPSQLVELGVRFDLIQRKGAYYTYANMSSQGRENFINDLINGNRLNSLMKEVYKKIDENAKA